MNIPLLYRANEYSIDIDAYAEAQIPMEYTVLINTLQLQVDDKGRIVYPWGYCPLSTAKMIDLELPQYHIGKLFVEVNRDIQIGSAIRYDKEMWRIYKSNQHSWFCIGNPSLPEEYIAVEFFPNCIAVIEEGKLVSLYLNPIIV